MALRLTSQTSISDIDSDGSPLVPDPPRQRVIVAAAFSALFYIMTMGMVASYSSPATVDMKRPGSRFRHITPNEITWIASLPMLTGVFGNAFSGYASNKLGRKALLMYVSVPYTFGCLMIAYAPSVMFIYTGRMITGFVAGMTVVTVPAYVVEVSTVNIRGFLSACFQVAYALGFLLTMILGSVLRWSSLAASGAGLVLLAATLMCFMPESPPWLVRQSRNAEAIWGLKFLKGKHYDALEEVREIRELMAKEPETGMSWREILDPALYRPLLISFALMFFQQFSGMSVLVSYTVELIKDTNTKFDPYYGSILVAVVQLCMTVVSSLLMDRAGRKPLFIFSGSLMGACLISLGVYSYYSRNSTMAELSHWSWVPLLSFAIYIAAYGVGFGSIPFVMPPELVPTRLRSFVMAAACVTCSFFGFVITKMFDDMRSLMGLSGCYWFYSIFAFSGCVFCWLVVPETKGRSIHEIHQSLSSSRKS